MSRGQKWRRVATTLAGVLALALGTVAGQDDHFPFGPFRMYSTTTTDRVTVLILEGVTIDGERRVIPSSAFGLRPAEMHGQIAHFEDRLPDLLELLVQSYAIRHPDQASFESLDLAYGVHLLENGRRIAYREEPLARWSR